MSVRKPLERDLMAIFRLEFYKKQKNWKLCPSHLNKKSIQTVKNTHDRNNTYNVENNFGHENGQDILKSNNVQDNLKHEELLDPMNDAVLDFELDKTSNSVEFQEPFNTWPNKTEEIKNKDCRNEQTSGVKPKMNFATKRLQELQRAASLLNCSVADQEGSEQEEINSLKLYPQCSDQKSNIGENNLEVDEIRVNCVEVEIGMNNLEVDEIGVNNLEVDQMGYKWNNPYFYSESSDYTEISVSNGNDWMTQSGFWPQQSVNNVSVHFTSEVFDYDNEMNISMVNLEAFMRGASCAPHSTALDNLSSMDIEDSSFSSLSDMSSERLEAVTRKYVHSLQRLLLETEYRQMQRRLTSLTSSSFLRQPCLTGDFGVGPFNQTRDTMLYMDDFVAGSHTNWHPNFSTATGRGRGRGNPQI